MTGVFGAGVVTVLEKMNIYDRIEAIYSASAGVMNGAYFLSHQTELGSSIYWENLNKGFISLKGFWIGVWQRFENRFIKKVDDGHLYDAINTDYLMSVVENQKVLDKQKIINSSIPFFVKLLNLDTHQMEFIDARRSDILNILKAGVHIFPYVHGVIKIDGKRYVDAAIPEIIGIRTLVNRHPNTKIIVVMNSPKKRKLTYRPKNILEGKFMEWMFNDILLYPIFAYAEDRLKEDLKYIKNDPSIILICPPDDFTVRSRTTDVRKLIDAWKLGVSEGEKIASMIIGDFSSNIVH